MIGSKASIINAIPDRWKYLKNVIIVKVKHSGDKTTVYARPLARLIEQLQRLPGVGPKSAQRLALHILKRPEAEVEALAQALIEAKNR